MYQSLCQLDVSTMEVVRVYTYVRLIDRLIDLIGVRAGNLMSAYAPNPQLPYTGRVSAYPSRLVLVLLVLILRGLFFFFFFFSLLLLFLFF